MMMHYLGLGVGHMNPAGFPSEADTISVIPEPCYVPAQTKTSNRSADIVSSMPVPIVVSDGAPVLPRDTNGQGTSNEDSVDDGAEEVLSYKEDELKNGDLKDKEEEEDDNFMEYNYQLVLSEHLISTLLILYNIPLLEANSRHVGEVTC